MEGEYVLGSKISVRYLNKDKGNIIAKSLGIIICGIPSESYKTWLPVVVLFAGGIVTRSRAVSESEIVTDSKQSSSKQMYATSASVLGTRTLQFPHYQSSSPVVGAFPAFNAHCTSGNVPQTGSVCQISYPISLSKSNLMNLQKRYRFFFFFYQWWTIRERALESRVDFYPCRFGLWAYIWSYLRKY